MGYVIFIGLMVGFCLAIFANLPDEEDNTLRTVGRLCAIPIVVLCPLLLLPLFGFWSESRDTRTSKRVNTAVLEDQQHNPTQNTVITFGETQIAKGVAVFADGVKVGNLVSNAGFLSEHSAWLFNTTVRGGFWNRFVGVNFARCLGDAEWQIAQMVKEGGGD